MIQPRRKLNYMNKRAETLLEVVMALFIVGVGVTTSSAVLNRTLNVTASNQLWLQAAFFAKEGLESVRNIRDTNWIKFAPEECWKATETANLCDPATSPMMADSSSPDNYYTIFFDYVDFTPQLNGPIVTANEFTNSAILSRLPNVYSIHKKFLNPSTEENPVFGEDVSGSENTMFYRQIRIQFDEIDLDGDGIYEEVLEVTSSVKWPYRNKVNTYTISSVLYDFKE